MRTSKIYSLSKFQEYNTVLSLLLFSCSVLSDSFSTSWTIALQAPPSMRFSRQEYWSGLPFPSPGDLPNPGIKPAFPALSRWVLSLLSREAHNTAPWTPITTLDLQNLLLNVCTLWPVFPHYPCTFSQPLATTVLLPFINSAFLDSTQTISDFLHLACLQGPSIQTAVLLSLSGWIMVIVCVYHISSGTPLSVDSSVPYLAS